MKTNAIIAASAAILMAAQSCTFIRFNKEKFDEFGSDVKDISTVLDGQIAGGTLNVGVSDFECLELNVPVDVEYSNSDVSSIVISADEKTLSHIVVKQDGDKVSINSDSKGSIKGKVSVKAASPMLSRLTANGAVDFKAENISGDKLSVATNGAADMCLSKICYANVGIVVNGAGDVEVSGSADAASVTVNGVGDVDMRNLDCDNITTSINGLGEVKRK